MMPEANVVKGGGKRVLVVSMTTWGERGNWLSGRSLGATLQACWPDAQVDVVAAEELMPLFGEVGKRIKAATIETSDPEERFAGYSRILRSLEPLFPAGFEDDPERYPSAAAELQTLAQRLRENPPDLLLGTKGIICRALIGALRLAGLERPVINYVTNHGHFQFAVHRVPGAALHLTRLPEGREYLIENCGWAPESIRVVGYLVAAQQLLQRGEVPKVDEGTTPHISVIIVSNRGGDEYVTVLERLVPFRDAIDVTFIALMDERLCSAANQVLREHGITRWRVADQLTQTELFHLMAQARAKGVCCLVCKASPNSIFEAVYFGLPMFLFRTGLPMEEWGADMVVSERIGWVAADVDDLTPPLLDSLSDISKLQPVIERQRAFAAQYLDQKLTIERLRDAVESVAASSPGTV
jgi:hypothetical protein